MAVLARSPNLLVQVDLEVVFALVLVRLQVGLDLGEIAENVKARVEVGLGRVLLVSGITLPLEIGLDGVHQLDGIVLAERDRLETLVGERRSHGGGSCIREAISVLESKQA